MCLEGPIYPGPSFETLKEQLELSHSSYSCLREKAEKSLQPEVAPLPPRHVIGRQRASRTCLSHALAVPREWEKDDNGGKGSFSSPSVSPAEEKRRGGKPATAREGRSAGRT